ncbi:YjbF family lipoprotein [Chachezhania sediminis]|uniref:YjbF family lipoprotein n=1 Tax=Chachezhania sediminis TaxID=2599291 RepID=UPI00131A828C|nr:YjbF family lipoprotein [Chachezhania sediminis]
MIRAGIRSIIIAASLAAALAGCDVIEGDGIVGQTLTSYRASRQNKGLDLRKSITPAAVEATGEPVIFVEVPNREAQAFLGLRGRNGPNDTWLTNDNISISYNDGVIVATRGLGSDVMTVDVSEVLPAIRGRRSEAMRVNRYLNGEGHIVPEVYFCDYARTPGVVADTALGPRSSTKIVEVCQGRERTFENIYWYAPGGKPLMSRQWISETNQYALTEFLNN